MPGVARTIGQVGTGAIIGEAGGAALRAVPAAASSVSDAASAAKAKIIGGSNLDQVINGDTVTPRQRYNAAQGMGVNLDTAQATNSPVAMRAKDITENSLGGASKFEANKTANTQALQAQTQKILDTAAPSDMSREDFGNAAKSRLLAHQQEMNDTAGSIYTSLDHDLGATTPDPSAVRGAAQKIVADNKAYYDAHPDLLSGGSGKAWKIVNNLAEVPKGNPAKTITSPILDSSGSPITTEIAATPGKADTWSDLHKLRSDLLDITRGPEIIGDRPTGWIKQLTGAVDDTMTKAADEDSTGDFRNANDIYKRMKETYDDPTSRLYHVVRSPDGLTAANTLANITPDVARKIGGAAPDLIPQLQRQTISRIINPTGNELPDLKNLSSRLGRAQKEQLAGVLTPEQITQLDNLGRTAKLVNYDANPSGSGKLAQKSIEAGAIGTGLMKSAAGIVTGNPLAVAEGVAPIAYTGAQRLLANKLTSPAFTDAIMNPPLKGQALWSSQGAAKLLDHIGSNSASTLTRSDIEELGKTQQGKSLLIRASGLAAGSPMMNSIVKQIDAMKSN